MIILQTNDISEKQLAEIALGIQNRWGVPTFVKMHEIVVMDDDLEGSAGRELIREFETGVYEVFDNLEILHAFRLKKRSASKYLIHRVPGSVLPQWMQDIESTSRIPEGVYACPHCVPADTLILGDNKQISKYTRGNTALGKTGLNNVIETFVRPYGGEITLVRANGLLPIVTTPEHPILATRSISIRRHRGKRLVNETLFSNEQWVPAKDLVVKATDRDGNYVVIPIVNGSFHKEVIDLSPFIKKALPRHKDHRSNFPLSVQSVWLLGLFVAEGSVTKSDVRFSLNSNEEEIRAKIDLIARELGYSSYVEISKVANSMLVSVPSRVLARAFDHWCGHRAPNKMMPDFILFHADERILRAFLEGYESGDSYDGTNRLRGNNIYRSCITTSKILAQQLQLAYARIGIWANVCIRQIRTRETIMRSHRKVNEKYCITYPLSPNPKRQKVKFFKDKIFSPVQEVTNLDYRGNVHNVATGDNTYLVSNAVVHNCGRWFPTDIQLSMHQKIHYIV